jgi:hypothetical protein
VLAPEKARGQLKTLQSPKRTLERLERVKNLPEPLRTHGLALVGKDAEGKEFADYNRRYEPQHGALVFLEGCPLAERGQVFTSLFPTLTVQLEATWQLLQRLPYTVGYARKAFRAPNRPGACRSGRQALIESIWNTLASLPDDVLNIEWLAAWAPHLAGYGQLDQFGRLFAAVIDAGGSEADALIEVLKDSARGEHEIGGMGRHISRALLSCSRPDCWEFIEKLLLAAQRKEGLRQVVFESVDEAHPEAFYRMLGLVREQKLLRFAALVRAFCVWLGYGLDVTATKQIDAIIGKLIRLRGDVAHRRECLDEGGGEDVFLALWSIAHQDAEQTFAELNRLVNNKSVERRYAAAYLMTQLQLPEPDLLVVGLMDDADLRVAAMALEHQGGYWHEPAMKAKDDRFERIERLLPRLPEDEKALDPVVWPWRVHTVSRQRAADRLIHALGDRPPSRLIPYLPEMGPWPKANTLGLLAQSPEYTSEVRDTFFALSGDASSAVREAALKGLQKCKIAPAEAQRLEAYLTRKASDLRRGVVILLLSQPDAECLASSDRLLTSPHPNQRLAGLELSRQLLASARSSEQCRSRARSFREVRKKLTSEENEHVEFILKSAQQAPTLDDCLGLLEGARTPVERPRQIDVQLITPAAVELIRSLDALIHERRETPLPFPGRGANEVQLLGNSYGFHHPDLNVPAEKDRQNLPLADLWEKWFETRSAGQRDSDGLELLRAWAWFRERVREGEQADADDSEVDNDEALQVAWKALYGKQKPAQVLYPNVVDSVLAWMVRLHPPEGAIDFLLDGIETSFARVPPDELARIPEPDNWRNSDWRDTDTYYSQKFWVHWLMRARASQELIPGAWTAQHHVRLWKLQRFRDEPGTAVPRRRAATSELLKAYEAGGTTLADVTDHLLGLREPTRHSYYRGGAFESLHYLTSINEGDGVPELKLPGLRDLVNRACERILEIELTRGEASTAASQPTLSIASLPGQETLFRLLRALGKSAPSRLAPYRSSLDRHHVLTHLINCCYDGKGEGPADFVRRAKSALQEGAITRTRLLELAFINTRFSTGVEAALGLKGLVEAVWWFIAHMGQQPDRLDPKQWAKLLAERTSLSDEQRREGAIDVGWFRRVHDAIGKKGWAEVAAAAKFGCSGMEYKKATHLADVLLGRVKKAQLVSSIRTKHLRDSVLLLGLLPLDPKGPEKDLHDRYKVLKEYERYARGLGPMSRESAVRAAHMGMANLSRTAGYPDPVRLEWAMEGEALADLAAGPVALSIKDVTITLALDGDGQPDIAVRRGSKELKAIPPELRKSPKVAALNDRKTELRRQASSLKGSLEAAMCRGDGFTGAELRQLFANPIVRPALERLVLIGDSELGYPINGGKALRDYSGKRRPIGKHDRLRIAHPHDLLVEGDWPAWQAECFRVERMQPFKQVFRELYVVTKAERADKTVSKRYSGQQVNQNQAMALLSSRGWATNEGTSKHFRDEWIVVAVGYQYGVTTPLEVEGLTLDTICFLRSSDWKPIPVSKVAPRIFSEVMRDLDLVVSVAHVGGVDPEATASTVEMRAALLRETCKLLAIDNVRIKDRHALIDGKLGRYTVHLGSAVVHKQPGGSLCVVAVQGQHRGRLFLPFADNDPRTAEVISKVVLLARDDQIQDPTILEQIAAR